MSNGTTKTNAVIECILSRTAAKYYDPAAASWPHTMKVTAASVIAG
jgi:hypothetical protein